MWDQITGHADPAHVAAVVDLARRAEPRCGDVVVVAIDGPSGSGKTTLAHDVTQTLDGQTLHLDRLYPGWDGLAETPGLLARQVLEPLATGSPAAYVRWDWDRDQWADTVTVEASRFLVVEGCGSSVRPARTYAAVRVFVDADPILRKRRGITRDGESYRPHWDQWAAQEAALFDRDGTRQHADLLIDTTSV